VKPKPFVCGNTTKKKFSFKMAHENSYQLGVPDNFSTETPESLHIKMCKEPYNATNRRNYDPQILNYLDIHDRLTLRVHFEAAQEMLQNLTILHDSTPSNVSPNPEPSPKSIPIPDSDEFSSLYTGAIKLCIKPHAPALSVSQVSQIYKIPQLVSSICRMLELQDNGTSLHRWEYSEEQLPPAFCFIDVWNYFRIAVPALSEYFESEYTSIHCKAENGSNAARHSPVFVEVSTAAVGIHRYRPAELRLVFRPRKTLLRRDLEATLYAAVFWYSKIPSRPNRDTKLYEVYQERDMQGNRRAGIIKLSSVKGLCPLAPIIEGTCPPTASAETCFDMFSKYSINAYASHTHFQHLRGLH